MECDIKVLARIQRVWPENFHEINEYQGHMDKAL